VTAPVRPSVALAGFEFDGFIDIGASSVVIRELTGTGAAVDDDGQVHFAICPDRYRRTATYSIERWPDVPGQPTAGFYTSSTLFDVTGWYEAVPSGSVAARKPSSEVLRGTPWYELARSWSDS
jgi:hypothetical protein